MGEVGALYPDPEHEQRFVYAVLGGEIQLDTDYVDSDDETEENQRLSLLAEWEVEKEYEGA